MSKQYPECPLYNHANCRELHNPKLCALVRKDKKCLRKLSKNVKRQKNKMGTVIEFPGDDKRLEKKFRETLDTVEYPNEDLRKCVTDSLVPLLIKYTKQSRHSFSLELPPSVSETEGKKIVEKIQEEIIKYVTKVQQEMFLDICILYVKLCKLELKGD